MWSGDQEARVQLGVPGRWEDVNVEGGLGPNLLHSCFQKMAIVEIILSHNEKPAVLTGEAPETSSSQHIPGFFAIVAVPGIALPAPDDLAGNGRTISGSTCAIAVGHDPQLPLLFGESEDWTGT